MFLSSLLLHVLMLIAVALNDQLRHSLIKHCMKCIKYVCVCPVISRGFIQNTTQAFVFREGTMINTATEHTTYSELQKHNIFTCFLAFLLHSKKKKINI